MGLTDAPKQRQLIDDYPPGTGFTVKEAYVEGLVDTKFGKRALAKVMVEPIAGGTPIEYPVWGALCEQVQQIEEGELPMAVTIVEDGNRKLFGPYDELADKSEPAATESAEEAPTS